MNSRQQQALSILTLVPELGSTLTRRCLETMDSGQAVVESTVPELACIKGIDHDRAVEICTELDRLADGRELDVENQLVDQSNMTLLAPYERRIRLRYATSLIHHSS